MSDEAIGNPAAPVGGPTESDPNQSVFNKPVHKTAKRNLMIIGGALLVAICVLAAVFAVSLKKKPEQAMATIGTINPRAVGPKNGEDANTLSPAMTENIRKAQAQEADTAKRNGKTYVDVEPPMGRGEKVVTNDLPSPNAAGIDGRTTSGNQQAAGTSYPNRQNANVDGLKRQVELMALSLEPVTTATVDFKSNKDDAQGKSALASTAVNTGSGNQKPLGPLLASGLEIFGGYLNSPVDTDKTTFTSATITGGKLDGAYLTGETKRSESDVGLHYTSMRLGQKVYEIDAIALNEQTASDAMDGKVDHHSLTKYVFPILLAAAGGYTQARAQTGSQVQSLGFGNNVLSVPSPTTAQATNAGIAKSVDVATQANQQYANRPNQITLESKTSVGILFRKPVYEQ